jgi:Zn-dependent protease
MPHTVGEGYDDSVAARERGEPRRSLTKDRSALRSIDVVDDPGHRRDSGQRQPGLRFGRLLGVPFHLNPSALLFAGLVTLTYGAFVERTQHFSPAVSYAVGLGFVVCLLVSAVLHELGHALVARHYGIGVKGITLNLLGGYTEMEREPPTPKVDLLVALAGPAVSLALGLVAGVATVALPAGQVVHQLVFQLAASNLIVAAFNVLPGLPLDGGRALRAAVWWLSRDRFLGTEVAGWIGRAVAGATALAAAVLSALGVFSPFGLVFMLLIALTLWQGAGQAQRRVAEAGPQGAALAVADSSGKLVALVAPGAAEAVPAERRPWVTVDTVARSLDGITAIPATLGGEEVIRALQANPGAEYLVTAGEDVVGVLRVEDLALLLEPKGK